MTFFDVHPYLCLPLESLFMFTSGELKSFDCVELPKFADNSETLIKICFGKYYFRLICCIIREYKYIN